MRGFPTLGLLCPFRLLMRALEFRWALAYLLSTLLGIPHEVSRVPTVRLKRDDVGGVFSMSLLRSAASEIVRRVESGLPTIPSSHTFSLRGVALLLPLRLEVSALSLTYQAR